MVPFPWVCGAHRAQRTINRRSTRLLLRTPPARPWPADVAEIGSGPGLPPLRLAPWPALRFRPIGALQRLTAIAERFKELSTSKPLSRSPVGRDLIRIATGCGTIEALNLNILNPRCMVLDQGEKAHEPGSTLRRASASGGLRRSAAELAEGEWRPADAGESHRSSTGAEPERHAAGRAGQVHVAR